MTWSLESWSTLRHLPFFFRAGRRIGQRSSSAAKALVGLDTRPGPRGRRLWNSARRLGRGGRPLHRAGMLGLDRSRSPLAERGIPARAAGGVAREPTRSTQRSLSRSIGESLRRGVGRGVRATTTRRSGSGKLAGRRASSTPPQNLEPAVCSSDRYSPERRSSRLAAPGCTLPERPTGLRCWC